MSEGVEVSPGRRSPGGRSFHSRGRETPITEFVMCSRHEQLPHVIGVGPQCATTNVRQKATVVRGVRGSRSNTRLRFSRAGVPRRPGVVVVVSTKQWFAERCLSVGVSACRRAAGRSRIGVDWPSALSRRRRIDDRNKHYVRTHPQPAAATHASTATGDQ